MVRAAFVCVCIFSVWLSACAPTAVETPDTRAADEKALRDLDAASLEAWKVKDVAKVASFYADDATVVIPNAPAVHGKAARQAALAGVTADPNFKLEFAPTGVSASKGGDMGTVKGTYTVIATDPKTQKPVMEKGNYLIVYRKQTDGSWKITEDYASPEGPATPVAN